MLDQNRLFPAEPTARAVAVKLYDTVRDLPIISPHGHTDPRWFAENKPFPNPAALFIQPDHYIFRMLYSQGVSLESLGIPQVDGKENADPREVWRIFAKYYYLFRGTPTRLWLDFAFGQLFGLTDRLSPANADEFYEIIAKKLETPEFLPRALFDRFNIEVRAADVPAGCGGGRGVHRLPGKPEEAGRGVGRGCLDVEGLPGGAALAAGVLQEEWRNGNRPWASDCVDG
jgi:glucuronate isomerase